MALQLNPDTTDDYESKTLAEMRSLVLSGLGFLDPLSNDNRTLAMIRTSIINRLGLAVALLANTDSYANILTDVYNASGFAAMGTHPPGVDTLIGGFINQAQRTLFARIEFDKGGVTPPGVLSGSTQTSIDATAVRMLAIALTKAHYGSQDAAAYGTQAEKYLSDLTQRTPPNITGQINAAIVDAHNTVLRRYEFGQSALGAPTFGFAILGNYASTASDSDTTLVDDQPVELLALANLKSKIGQADAKAVMDQYGQYMVDVIKRQPPNAVSLVNSTLKMTQQMLYRKYDVFRMERWFTWSLVAGERFYGTFNDDNASSLAPTNGLATIGPAVTTHNLGQKRYLASHVTLNDGRVLIAGGTDGDGNVLSSAEIFDPATGQFESTGSLSQARYQAAAVKLDSGDVWISGGYFGTSLITTEVYQVATGTFVPGPSFAAGNGRAGHTATLLADGTVLVVGGDGSGTHPAIYDPNLGVITNTTGTLSHPRVLHTATFLADGRVLIAGGNSAFGNTAETYDPIAQTFTLLGSTMASQRALAAATVMANGQVLISGGSSTAVVPTPTPVLTTDIFDPVLNTFSATGSMAHARYGHGSVLLANEKVLVAGDNAGGTTGETFNLATATWSTVSNAMPIGVTFGTFDAMQNGKVLIAGGMTGTITDIPAIAPAVETTVNTAMFYDPLSDQFVGTGNLNQGTVFYQITAYTTNGESLPGAEFFLAAVPANHAVILTWVPVVKQPFVKGFKIYGRVTGGTKQLIATIVGKNVTTYTDEGTIEPFGALPTENNTAGPGRIDPRHVTWVGLSFNDNVWNPLIKGIPPMMFAQNINGVPTHYEIRQSLEIWPAPTTTDWKIQVKGYFEPQVFESDDDSTTIDWQALYLRTLADLKVTYKQPDAMLWEQRAKEYIGALISGSHMTAHYVPGAIPDRNATRPVLLGPYIGYP